MACCREKLRREEAELAQQDAEREREAADRARRYAERRREIQAAYSDSFASFGTEVPAPVDDELPERISTQAIRPPAMQIAERSLAGGHQVR